MSKIQREGEEQTQAALFSQLSPQEQVRVQMLRARGLNIRIKGINAQGGGIFEARPNNPAMNIHEALNILKGVLAQTGDESDGVEGALIGAGQLGVPVEATETGNAVDQTPEGILLVAARGAAAIKLEDAKHAADHLVRAIATFDDEKLPELGEITNALTNGLVSIILASRKFLLAEGVSQQFVIAAEIASLFDAFEKVLQNACAVDSLDDQDIDDTQTHLTAKEEPLTRLRSIGFPL